MVSCQTYCDASTIRDQMLYDKPDFINLMLMKPSQKHRRNISVSRGVQETAEQSSGYEDEQGEPCVSFPLLVLTSLEMRMMQVLVPCSSGAS